MRRLLLLALILALMGCDVRIQRGGVEPPPPGAPKGVADGYRTIYMDPSDLDRFCRDNGVDAQDEYARKLGG